MGKDSFLIYKSFYEAIKDFSEKEMGILFRSLFEWQIEKKEPNRSSPIYVAFMFFKNQFNLDDGKYEKTVTRNKLNGSKGGRPKTESVNKNPNNPLGLIKPKKADNDNDNDNDNDIERRKENFKNEIYPHSKMRGGIYENEMLKSFFEYWSEPNKSKTKLRYQLEKTWDLSLRLKRWASKEIKPQPLQGTL